MSLNTSITHPLINNFSQETQLSPIYHVPQEILMYIFGFLSKEDLGKAAQVCRIWKEWVGDNFLCCNADLKTQFPSIQIIDKTDWKTFLDVDIIDEPPLCKHTDIPVLQNLISSLEGKIEGDAGITIITIPKNLDLNKLLALASNPKQGNAIKSKHIFAGIIEEFGDKSVSKTVRVVITNNIFKGSRNKSAEQQKNLVENLGLEMLELLPTLSLIFMTYIRSQEKPPTRLFNDNPYTYTFLKEKINNWNLIVGGFASGGFLIGRNCIVNSYDGVGGLQWL